MTDIKEARKRSVDNLQRLFAFVVGLAVTEALRRTLSPLASDYAQWLVFTTFVVTAVPFYHGTNMYLDATYVLGSRTSRQYALMLDFIFLFVEGLLLFALALQTDDLRRFYTLLAILFVFDAVWVRVTVITTDAHSAADTIYARWAVVNVSAAALVLFLVWSPLIRSDVVRNLALAATALGRTIYDYRAVWRLYYPSEDRNRRATRAASQSESPAAGRPVV